MAAPVPLQVDSRLTPRFFIDRNALNNLFRALAWVDSDILIEVSGGREERSCFVEAVQTAAPAKTSHILHGIEGRGPFLANSDEFPHRLHLLIPSTEKTLPSGFPHQFRDIVRRWPAR